MAEETIWTPAVLAALAKVNVDEPNAKAETSADRFVETVWFNPLHADKDVFNNGPLTFAQEEKLIAIIEKYGKTRFFEGYLTWRGANGGSVVEVHGLSTNEGLLCNEDDILATFLDRCVKFELIYNKKQVTYTFAIYGTIEVIRVNDRCISSMDIDRWLYKQPHAFYNLWSMYDPDDEDEDDDQNEVIRGFLNSLDEPIEDDNQIYKDAVGPIQVIDPNPSFYLRAWNEWDRLVLLNHTEVRERVFEIFRGMFSLRGSKQRILELPNLQKLIEWCPALLTIKQISDTCGDDRTVLVESIFDEIIRLTTESQFKQILKVNELHLHFTEEFLRQRWNTQPEQVVPILTRSLLLGPGRIITRRDALRVFGLSYMYVDIIISMLDKRTQGPLFHRLKGDLIRKLAGFLSISWS